MINKNILDTIFFNTCKCICSSHLVELLILFFNTRIITSACKSSYSLHNTELDHLQIYLPSYLIVVTFAITWRACCTFSFSKNNREGYLAPALPSFLQNPVFLSIPLDIKVVEETWWQNGWKIVNNIAVGVRQTVSNNQKLLACFWQRKIAFKTFQMFGLISLSSHTFILTSYLVLTLGYQDN